MKRAAVLFDSLAMAHARSRDGLSMKRRKLRLFLLGALAFLTAASTMASAHADMVATARLDVEIGSDRTVRSLRHLWRFDEETSTDVIADFDANGDDRLDEAELEDVARNVEPTLAENGYFQRVMNDGRRVPMTPPDNLAADFADGHLLIMFKSAPHAPLPLEGTIDIRVFDATLGTVIAFDSDDDMAIHGLPDDCTHRVVRPDMDKTFEENRKALGGGPEAAATQSEILRVFTPRLKITCPAETGK